ncbi:hypothetical protein GGTG_12009 [Gaeumannomyces tritici R3-111a-1]|uniref:DJ-1/PfpI domain-containing protein n=1 Tax=Gaeumannomyces tritici (strain R3-111a-1) TaxID=644352 RepID=J3PET0_GAET3|nr:hypothetical protein GGTG_12009 [Gaeumannomyces tritici R3-111a-1]EJT70988.1 hypothetical protein GGTG_12009 [Gaeumannomyces tritici R3-111a-1]
MALKHKALMVLFPGFNTLDMNGPFEVLTRGDLFEVVTAAESDITRSSEGVQVKRDVPLDDALIDKLHEFDVLVVPGGPGSQVMAQADADKSSFLPLIDKFAGIGPRPSASHPRLLLSVCTGALFLGKLGAFNGMHCTTHWAYYKELARLNEESAAAAAAAGGSPSEAAGKVLPARFVDAGVNGRGVRVVSSGGVSCGIDAALHVVRVFAGEAAAREAAEGLDYAWRKTDGVVLG